MLGSLKPRDLLSTPPLVSSSWFAKQLYAFCFGAAILELNSAEYILFCALEELEVVLVSSIAKNDCIIYLNT